VAQIYITGIKSSKIAEWDENIELLFRDSFNNAGLTLETGDIVVVTSKIYSMSHRNSVRIDDVIASDAANKLGDEANLDPRIAELIITESNNHIFGSVKKAVLAKNNYGLSANAGIDLSNSPKGYALLLPKNPEEDAQRLRDYIINNFQVKVAVIIIDSRTVPLRRGTFAIALATAGMIAVQDEREKLDLYKRQMLITTRAVADNVATAANLVMGETDEQTPFAVVKGVDFMATEQTQSQDLLMPEDQCLYFAPLMKLIAGRSKHEN